MSAAAALQSIAAAGLSVSLIDTNSIKVTPAALLTPALRALIQDHKPGIALALNTLKHDDTRVTCPTCRWLQSGNRCTNHRRADLMSRELAAQFVSLRQHCRGFAPIARPPPPAPHPRPIQTDPRPNSKPFNPF